MSASGVSDGSGGGASCTLRRAMSAVVGDWNAAVGLNGELGLYVGRVVGGSGAPATGISTEDASGTVTCGRLAWGTNTADENAVGLFVTAALGGHWPHAIGPHSKKMMQRLNTPAI